MFRCVNVFCHLFVIGLTPGVFSLPPPGIFGGQDSTWSGPGGSFLPQMPFSNPFNFLAMGQQGFPPYMPGWGAGDPFQPPVSAAAPTVSSAGTFPAVIPSLPGVMPLPDLSKPPPAGSLAPLPVPGVSSATDITSFGSANVAGSMSPDPPPPGTENDLANIILPSVMTPKQQPAVSVPSFLSPRFLAEAMIESPQNKVIFFTTDSRTNKQQKRKI
jgi:hypothetical protein